MSTNRQRIKQNPVSGSKLRGPGAASGQSCQLLVDCTDRPWLQVAAGKSIHRHPLPVQIRQKVSPHLQLDSGTAGGSKPVTRSMAACATTLLLLSLKGRSPEGVFSDHLEQAGGGKQLSVGRL